MNGLSPPSLSLDNFLRHLQNKSSDAINYTTVTASLSVDLFLLFFLSAPSVEPEMESLRFRGRGAAEGAGTVRTGGNTRGGLAAAVTTTSTKAQNRCRALLSVPVPSGTVTLAASVATEAAVLEAGLGWAGGGCVTGTDLGDGGVGGGCAGDSASDGGGGGSAEICCPATGNCEDVRQTSGCATVKVIHLYQWRGEREIEEKDRGEDLFEEGDQCAVDEPLLLSSPLRLYDRLLRLHGRCFELVHIAI